MHLSRGQHYDPGSQVLEVANRSDDVDHEQPAQEPRQNDVWVGHCGDLSRLTCYAAALFALISEVRISRGVRQRTAVGRFSLARSREPT